MLEKILKFAGVLSVIILLAVLNLTTPVQVGPLGVLVFFTALYTVVLNIAVFFMKGFWKLAGTKGNLGRKGFLYAASLAFFPVMLLFLQSLEIMSPAMIGLAVLLEAIVLFLISKKL